MDSIVSMTGRLGTDVERRTSRNGTPYVRFRLGATRRVQRDGEWTDAGTTWVSVRCYRHLAVNTHYSLQKGDPVIVVGRLRVETWVTESGVQRESTVLDADAVGHDLTWGTDKFNRGEGGHRAEPAPVRQPEAEVVDPETGEVVDLATGEVLAGPETEHYDTEPVPEKASVGH
jgi:single-strand DNA-binding protein